MFKSRSNGFVVLPIVLLGFVILISGVFFARGVLELKTPDFVEPFLVVYHSPVPSSTSSAEINNTAKKVIPSMKVSASTKPSTTLAPSPTNSNNSNNSTNQNTNSNNNQSANTSTSPSSTPAPIESTAPEAFSVNKTSVTSTIKRNGKTTGMGFGDGITATSNTSYGYSVANDQGQSGVGLESGSTGLLPGQSRNILTFITFDKPNGTYTGTNTITYYDENSKSHTGPTINYTITLTD